MFVVQLLREEMVISVGNMSPPLQSTIKLSYAKGMVGALPVFDTYDNALKYAKGKEFLILEIKGIEDEHSDT